MMGGGIWLRYVDSMSIVFNLFILLILLLLLVLDAVADQNRNLVGAQLIKKINKKIKKTIYTYIYRVMFQWELSLYENHEYQST